MTDQEKRKAYETLAQKLAESGVLPGWTWVEIWSVIVPVILDAGWRPDGTN